MTSQQLVIRPNKGPQEQFLNIPAEVDIVFTGGGAGGGKSYSLLLDALKYVDDPAFYAVFFRQTTKQLEASLWPAACDLYLPFITHQSGPNKGKYIGKAKIQQHKHEIHFPSGARLAFSYLDSDKSARLNWQGAELSAVYWDEFTHFTEFQFNYLRKICAIIKQLIMKTSLIAGNP